jgi:phage gp45-like
MIDHLLERRVAFLERQVDRLLSRRDLTFTAARSTMVPDESGAVQKVQAQLDPLSVRDGIPVLYHYGFFSSPPVGTDMHICFLNNSRSDAVVVASNHQEFRFNGAASGDAGLYANGKKIHLNQGGIEVTGDISQSGNQTITGDLYVTGEIIGRHGGASVTVTQHRHPADDTPPTPGT